MIRVCIPLVKSTSSFMLFSLTCLLSFLLNYSRFIQSLQVVITKCYHLFCNPCVQKVTESRHRKCPGCAASFSPNDVKPVYIWMENGNLTYIPHQEHLSIFKHVSCCNDSRFELSMPTGSNALLCLSLWRGGVTNRDQ